MAVRSWFSTAVIPAEETGDPKRRIVTTKPNLTVLTHALVPKLSQAGDRATTTSIVSDSFNPLRWQSPALRSDNWYGYDGRGVRTGVDTPGYRDLDHCSGRLHGRREPLRSCRTKSGSLNTKRVLIRVSRTMYSKVSPNRASGCKCRGRCGRHRQSSRCCLWEATIPGALRSNARRGGSGQYGFGSRPCGASSSDRPEGRADAPGLR
jgi:hypothetical protein